MKSVLIIGMGKFGRHLAQKLISLGNEVMLVDKNEGVVERYAATFSDAQIADCMNENVLRSLGVSDFDLCFVAIADDFQSSLVITALLKEFDAKYVIAKAKSDIQADLLRRIGADEVIYPEREMAEKLAMRYNATDIFDYIELTEEYAIYEIPVRYYWIGKTITELDIRRKYRINIIAVKVGNDLNIMPGPDYCFAEHDHIVVIGTAEDIHKLSKL
ncbi:MAG: TrkA family potassium uptake protein [Clostridia bacterium]|nr:TrkA family potassium uptake protein [Clostridia bacterium]